MRRTLTSQAQRPVGVDEVNVEGCSGASPYAGPGAGAPGPEALMVRLTQKPDEVAPSVRRTLEEHAVPAGCFDVG